MKKYNYLLSILLLICIIAAGGCSSKSDSSDTTVAEKEEKEAKKEKKKDKKEKKEKESETETETEKESLDYANLTPEDLIKDFEGKTELNKEEFMDLLSTFEYVEFYDDYSLASNITSKAIYMLNDNDVDLPYDEVIPMAIKSDIPQLRAWGYSQMSSIFGISDENIESSVKMLSSEKDPHVIAAAVRYLGSEGGANPDIAAFLLESAKHEDPVVRMWAASSIGSSWNENMEGALEAMLELMKDSDPKVREWACTYIGNLGKEEAVAPLAEILNTDEEYELHGACMDSLSTLWLDYPFHEKHFESAYLASMEYFKKTPRSENTPFWLAVNNISNIDEDSIEAWKANAPFYNPDEIVSLMTDIVADPNADFLARTSAIDVIKAHGTREQLEALAPTIEGLSDSLAEQIQGSYQDALNN
ncbi:MAG: HEAT repeat domain-containing protein [Johnsonella sp.]|nr:HEAT repeat domain-containing protein [Johnsonella sp.]